MKVRLLVDLYNTNPTLVMPKGAVIEVSDATAAYLISNGEAEPEGAERKTKSTPAIPKIETAAAPPQFNKRKK